MSLANRTIDLASKQVLVAADGTAAAPSITNDGDTNTGMFFPAADTIAFSEGGVESMRIDSSGNVGIGTTTPSAKLDVVGSLGVRVNEDGAGTKVVQLRSNYSSLGPAVQVTTNDPLLFLTNNTERLRIDSSGNVGIGTASPSYKFDITANTNGAIVNASGASDNIGFRVSNTQTGGKAYRILASATGSGYSAGGLVFEDQAVGARMTIDSSGNVGIGTTSPSSKLHISGGDDIVRLVATDPYLSFYNGSTRTGYIRVNNTSKNFSIVSEDATTPLTIYTNSNERLRIDSSGNVGIGVNSPAARFHVDSSNPSNGMVSVFRNSGASLLTGSQIQITQNSVDDWAFGQPAGVSAFAFWSGRNGNTTGVERLRIDSSGRVGIGTSSPDATLQVARSTSQTDIDGVNQVATFVNTSSDTSGNLTGIRLRQDNATNAAQGFIGLSSTGNVATRANLVIATPNTAGNSTERLRINSSGDVFIGSTNYTWDERFLVYRTTNQTVAGFYANNTSFTTNLIIGQTETTPSTAWRFFVGRAQGGNERIIIYGNGNLQNTNGSYGAISDIAFKENIVDATPKLSDLCRVKIRNYNLKDDDTNTKQIGVIAQELEEVFPSLVEGSEGNKGVKYSIFIPMLIKAVQELSAKVSALEAT